MQELRGRRALVRSLAAPIDTAGPSGLLVLKVLGVVAEFERALIRKRTRAGLGAAKARGRVGGNPGLRARDPDAVHHARSARDAAHLNAVLEELDAWLPTVRRMRPEQPWGDVVRVLNRDGAPGAQRWTVERLRRTVRRLATEGIVEQGLLGRAPPPTGSDRLVRLVGGIAAAAPEMTLQQIATQLEGMRERTPRGGTRWHPSSVLNLLRQAERLGVGRRNAAQR